MKTTENLLGHKFILGSGHYGMRGAGAKAEAVPYMYDELRYGGVPSRDAALKILGDLSVGAAIAHPISEPGFQRRLQDIVAGIPVDSRFWGLEPLVTFETSPLDPQRPPCLPISQTGWTYGTYFGLRSEAARTAFMNRWGGAANFDRYETTDLFWCVFCAGVGGPLSGEALLRLGYHYEN